MAVYEKRTCPHCGNILKYYEMKSSHGKFGTPIIRCQNCRNLIKTDKKLWRDINFFEKTAYLFSLFMSSVIVGFGAPLILGIISLFIFEEEQFEKHVSLLLIVWIVTFTFFFSRNILVLKENIKVIESDFDKQNFEYQDY